MDTDNTFNEADFRAEVRSFVEAHLPEAVRGKILRGEKLLKEEYVDWQRKLYGKGWIAPSWPKELGGTGWSLMQRRVFHHELALCCAPETIPFGITMVGPVIYTFGTQAQKERYLPSILKSEEWWCQGFSEPNAGSDLAALGTRADDMGDHYLVNGQKAWTTHGKFADKMFCLARTTKENKRQEGISFLLLDMTAPGVEVRPVMTIDEGASICEVFLKDVKVPKENLVGEVGKGWSYAKFLLGHERAMIARVGRSRMQLTRAKDLLGQVSATEALRAGLEMFQMRLQEIECRLRALEVSELRVLSQHTDKGFDPSMASMLKIEGSEICQQLTELLVDLGGRYAMAYEGRTPSVSIGPDYRPGLMGDHLFNRVATIYGGSNEIQKNIIAKSRLDV